MKPRHKKVTLNTGEVIHFDSGHEFEVWKVLSQSPCVELVDRQFPLPIKPATSFYRSRSWRADFRVKLINFQLPKIVEAKSYATAHNMAFRLTLESLDLMNPHVMPNLLIVLPDSNISSCQTIAKFLGMPKKQVIGLTDLRARLEVGCLL
jgi:hypothetical protein